ncbi:serine/threonine protein kinase [Gimesia sp.]|uniref:serine/threonine protein kinase n=1 Tax=Gimesia sp. TaxID=2024833 RepID=UPI003A8DFDF0
MTDFEDSLVNTFVYRRGDSEDPRVIEISREYLALLEAGQTPEKLSYIDRYPELSEVVEECLDGIDLAHSLSQHLSPRISEMLAQPLGDFKIVREIGHGGMATVYEAIQLSLGRRVALKVLPFAASLDECQRQRFQIESQAAANLHHTNIVPVHAVGCERGMHYYAMQLIDGESLSEWILRQRAELSEHQFRARSAGDQAEVLQSAGAGSQVRSSVTESVTHTDHRQARVWYQTIARIIAQVAEALDYAHESGVVHRDIKPANLLVDVKGNAWITDFGLAQVTAGSSVTRTGDLVGTLRYMSPEQLSGKRTLIDQRTDIYSLGATLYELLCLQPIFSASDRQRLLHNILYDEPRPLREMNRLIPVELETIVMKALSKVPGERYQSAAELADDLHRFLDERPILARRPTMVDRARKWLRRHPSVIVSSFIILLLGIVGLSISMAAISHEEQNTRLALDREQQRAAEAEERLALAQRAADDMLALAEIELSHNPFDESLRKKLLESALAHYEAVIEEQQGNPEALEKLKITRRRIEQSLSDLIALQLDRETQILLQPDVQTDLNLTVDQKQKLTELVDWRQNRIQGGLAQIQKQPATNKGQAASTIRHRIIADAKATRSGLEQFLTAQQLQRLKQLTLRFEGTRALHETDVIRSLHLTNEQRMAMRAVESEFRLQAGARRMSQRENDSDADPHVEPSRDPDRPRPRGASPQNRRTRRPPHGPDQEVNEEELQEILKLLTAAQLEQWNRLVGAPFAGSLQDTPDPFRPK